MNLDPRQRTLDGFELPADALASLNEGATLGTSGPAEQEQAERKQAVQQPVAQEPAVPAPATAFQAVQEESDRTESSNETLAGNRKKSAPPRRQPPARPAAEPVASMGRAADAPSSEALAQAVATLQAALAEERREARESRRKTARLFAIAIVILFLTLGLGVVQTVVAVRTSHESAAAQKKTEALLRAQQTELAAFIDAASAASADIRSEAEALDVKLDELPSRTSPAQPPGARHAPRSRHPRRTNEKTRSAY